VITTILELGYSVLVLGLVVYVPVRRRRRRRRLALGEAAFNAMWKGDRIPFEENEHVRDICRQHGISVSELRVRRDEWMDKRIQENEAKRTAEWLAVHHPTWTLGAVQCRNCGTLWGIPCYHCMHCGARI